MKKVTPLTLLVDDNDVECKTNPVLHDMTVANLGFIPKDLEKFDLIVYQGKLGTKILRSKYTKIGEIK